MPDACLAGLYVAKSYMADVCLPDFSMFEFCLVEFFLAGCCLADPSMIELRQADLCSCGGVGRCTWLLGEVLGGEDAVHGDGKGTPKDQAN